MGRERSAHRKATTSLVLWTNREAVAGHHTCVQYGMLGWRKDRHDSVGCYCPGLMPVTWYWISDALPYLTAKLRRDRPGPRPHLCGVAPVTCMRLRHNVGGISAGIR